MPGVSTKVVGHGHGHELHYTEKGYLLILRWALFMSLQSGSNRYFIIHLIPASPRGGQHTCQAATQLLAIFAPYLRKLNIEISFEANTTPLRCVKISLGAQLSQQWVAGQCVREASVSLLLAGPPSRPLPGHCILIAALSPLLFQPSSLALSLALALFLFSSCIFY